MARVFVVVVGMVIAYVAGLVTVPLALRISGMRHASNGAELRWTPEGGWETRDVAAPPELNPPNGTQVAGIVGEALPRPSGSAGPP